MSDNVTITLLTSAQSGALASIIIKVSALGLRYKKKLNNNSADSSRLELYFEGVLSCSEEDLVKTLEANKHVDTVEKIDINGGISKTTETLQPSIEVMTAEPLDEINEIDELDEIKANLSKNKPQTSSKPDASDALSQTTTQLAEDHLSEEFGIVAPLLVEAAARKSQTVGELFLALAEELQENKRAEFLSLVNNLHVAV